MHPSPFAEDDKQWPGEDVTSTSQYQKFDQEPKKGAIQNGRPGKSLKSKRKQIQEKRDTPPDERRERDNVKTLNTSENPRLCNPITELRDITIEFPRTQLSPIRG